MEQKSTTEFDARLGAKIRMVRLLIGMSQEELAKALGLTFQQVQKYEKGTNRISAARLKEIARVLERPITLFYEVEDFNGVDLLGADPKLVVKISRIKDPLHRAMIGAIVDAISKLDARQLAQEAE